LAAVRDEQFSTFIPAPGTSLYRRATLLTGNPSDAEDLTQIGVGTISLEDASHAIDEFQLITNQEGVQQTLPQSLTVELTANGWKISQSVYSGVQGPFVDSCPPK
jgi:hypothetical protein